MLTSHTCPWVCLHPHQEKHLGEAFLLTVGAFCLQLSFPAQHTLSHCEQKAPTASKKAKAVSKKLQLWVEKLKLSTVSRKLPTVSRKLPTVSKKPHPNHFMPMCPVPSLHFFQFTDTDRCGDNEAGQSRRSLFSTALVMLHATEALDGLRWSLYEEASNNPGAMVRRYQYWERMLWYDELLQLWAFNLLYSQTWKPSVPLFLFC